MPAEVLVVGAGPTGLVAALLLAARGVPSTVVDRHRGVRPEPRAVHLDGRAVRILRRAGVGDAFTAVGRPGSGLRMLDARGRPFAEFPRAARGPDGHAESTLFHQPDLERVLREAVARQPAITLREGVGLTGLGPGAVAVLGDAGTRDVAAVLGCDGAGSTVRRLIGARRRDRRFRERWCVLDVRPDGPLTGWGGVEQRCDRHRPATFVPLPGGRVRFEFRMRPGETVDGLRAALGPLTASWRGRLPAAALHVERAAEYVVRAGVADRWRAGRVLLLGDAAHVTPPFVGQGLGAGLRDADDATWKLAAVLRGDPAGEDVLLDSYQREREPDVAAAITGAVRVGRAMAHPRAAAALRLPAVRRVAERAMEVRRPPGPLVDAPRHRRDPVGTTCPQLTVGGHLLDDLLDGGWLVLTAGPVPPALVERADRADRAARAVVLGPDDGGARRWLAGRGTAAVLLRPDAVVAASAPARPGDAAQPRSSAA